MTFRKKKETVSMLNHSLRNLSCETDVSGSIDWMRHRIDVLSSFELAVYAFLRGDTRCAIDMILELPVFDEDATECDETWWKNRFDGGVDKIISLVNDFRGGRSDFPLSDWIVANILFKCGLDWERAHEMFLTIADKNPKSAHAHYSVADLFIRKCGWADMAFIHGDKAVSCDETFPYGYLARGRSTAEIDCEWPANPEIVKPNIANALKDFERAVELAPNLKEGLLFLGLYHLEMGGDLVKAANAFKRGKDLEETWKIQWPAWLDIVEHRSHQRAKNADGVT